MIDIVLVSMFTTASKTTITLGLDPGREASSRPFFPTWSRCARSSSRPAHFGRLDVLHNNAAITAPNHIAKDTDPVEFDVGDRTFAVNVRGYLAGCKYAIPHMLVTGGGSIVLTVSGSATFGDLSNIAYGSSKAAIVSTRPGFDLRRS